MSESSSDKSGLKSISMQGKYNSNMQLVAELKQIEEESKRQKLPAKVSKPLPLK